MKQIMIKSVFVLLSATCCFADTRNVPSDYSTIQAAIDVSNDGDVVIVAPGTYTGDGNRDMDFKGKAITVKSHGGPETCIINCDGSEEDPHRGFNVYSQSEAKAVLDGFTVINGYVDGSGGGIFCGDSGIVKNCIITNNRAVGGGGAFITGNGILINCIITDNMTMFGGGVAASDGDPVIINCTIYGNRVSRLGGGITGGYRGTATIENCIIIGNKAGSGNQLSTNISTIKPAMKLICRNCCIQSESREDIMQQGGIITIENTLFMEEPGFVNPELGDFRLHPDSPCVDAGTITTSVELPSVDIWNNPRISDGNRDEILLPDIGAYELPAPKEPYIWVSQTQLDLVINQADPNSKTQVLTLQNLGLQSLNWTIVEDCEWLQALPESGSSGQNSVNIIVTVDNSDLETGIYSCNLVISDENALNNPQSIPVTLRIPKVILVPDEFETIQEAIDAANLYDIIILGDGIYDGPGNYDISFRGKPITVRSENGPDNCIIGNQSDIVDYESVFVFNTQEDRQSILDGVTILADNSKIAILCNQSHPKIRHCHIFGHNSQGFGIILLGSDPAIENCVLKNCYRGIKCQLSNPEISNCKLHENITALYFSDSSKPFLHSCDIINNKGQGIYSEYGGKFRLFDSQINGNGWDNRSPALRCNRNTLTVQIFNCTISSNYAGLKCNGTDVVEIENSLISDNGRGNNQTGYGIYSEQCELHISNSTLTGNSNYGLYFSYTSQFQLRNAILKNNILWGNESNQISGDTDLCLATYSNIQDGWPGNGNIDVDPLFADIEDGDYHLKSQAGRWDPVSESWVIDDVTSPCIDAGDPDNPIGDELEPNGGRINMGAYGGTTQASKSQED